MSLWHTYTTVGHGSQEVSDLYTFAVGRHVSCHTDSAGNDSAHMHVGLTFCAASHTKLMNRSEMLHRGLPSCCVYNICPCGYLLLDTSARLSHTGRAWQEHTSIQLRSSGRTIIESLDILEFWGYAQHHQPPFSLSIRKTSQWCDPPGVGTAYFAAILQSHRVMTMAH